MRREAKDERPSKSNTDWSFEVLPSKKSQPPTSKNPLSTIGFQETLTLSFRGSQRKRLVIITAAIEAYDLVASNATSISKVPMAKSHLFFDWVVP